MLALFSSQFSLSVVIMQIAWRVGTCLYYVRVSLAIIQRRDVIKARFIVAAAHPSFDLS